MARRDGSPPCPVKPAPRPERQKREARPDKVAAFGIGISAESRAAVKARAKLNDAAEAVTERQKQRIAAAAEIWLAANPMPAIRDMRFDAILVAPGKLPRHILAAFETN